MHICKRQPYTSHTSNRSSKSRKAPKWIKKKELRDKLEIN